MYDSLEEIREVIRETCDKCNKPEAANVLTKNLKFSNRMTRAVGNCNRLGVIKLSGVYWPRIEDENKKNTIIHEVCHYLVMISYPRAKSHGWEWKAMMIKAGIKNPQRLFKGKVDMENFPKRKSRKKYMALCPCGAKPRFTKKVETKIVTGAAIYSCGKCKRPIKIGDIVYAETEKPIYPFIASISKE